MHLAVTHALGCVQQRKPYDALVLDTSFIHAPLKGLLSTPDRDALRRLAALEVRYARYRSSLMAQGLDFNVDTRFLLAVSELPTGVLAQQLTGDTLQELCQLSNDSVVRGDSCLGRLGARWDQLCHDTQEVAAVGDVDEKLVALGWVPYPATGSPDASMADSAFTGIVPAPELFLPHSDNAWPCTPWFSV